MLASKQMLPHNSSHDWVLSGAGVLVLGPLLCPKNGTSLGIRRAGNSRLAWCCRPGPFPLEVTNPTALIRAIQGYQTDPSPLGLRTLLVMALWDPEAPVSLAVTG